MKRSDLTEFAIEEEGFKLKICRGADGTPVMSNGRMPVAVPMAAESAASPPPASSPPVNAGLAATAAPQEEPGITYIKSPMVGTFYRAASPESPAFIEPGAKVEEKTVVCIIEAMKIMNEIESEYSGVVKEINVEDAQPVEYGQVLFKIDPNG